MNTTKIKTVIFVAVIFLCVTAPVKADWDDGDSYKMHFPQLPDPQGVDVDAWSSMHKLADDWQCTETGLVTDIHIWGSWSDDCETTGSELVFHLEIWDDNTSGPYSKPGTCQWERYLNTSDYKVRCNDTGPQGFYVPQPPDPYFEPDNHNLTYQYNFYIAPSEAFRQEEGNIYWLVVSSFTDPCPEGRFFGVKNTTVPFRDAAVFWNITISDWSELRDPSGSGLLDLAFVITGESQPSPVSALTPIGLMALVGVLSAIAAVTVVRERR